MKVNSIELFHLTNSCPSAWNRFCRKITKQRNVHRSRYIEDCYFWKCRVTRTKMKSMKSPVASPSRTPGWASSGMSSPRVGSDQREHLFLSLLWDSHLDFALSPLTPIKFLWWSKGTSSSCLPRKLVWTTTKSLPSNFSILQYPSIKMRISPPGSSHFPLLRLDSLSLLSF